jgi:hypothetical protein
MAYLGRAPSETSTGERVRRGGITNAGYSRARRVLIEAAWTYRFPARMSRLIQERQEDLPRVVRAIACKGQFRLCGRYRKLIAAGKLKAVTWRDGGLPMGHRPGGRPNRGRLIPIEAQHAGTHRNALPLTAAQSRRLDPGGESSTNLGGRYPSTPESGPRQPPDEHTEMRYPTRG